MFVYDTADPRIFLPRPSGLGLTLNFAHPVSWLILGVIPVLVGIAAYRKYGRKR
jgi:uncharacterized membrane protein